MNKDLKEKIRTKGKKVLQFLFNPRLLLCIAIGWMITNGWSYVLAGLGTLLDIKWMMYVGGAYIGLLWFPFTPEKIFTVAIAIFLLKVLFPGDTKTLAVLREMYESAKSKIKLHKEKKASEKKEAENEES